MEIFINCRRVLSTGRLHGLLGGGLVSLGPLDNLAGLGVGGGHGLAAALAVHVHQLGQVEPGPLHHLHFPDVHVVKGVDACKYRDITTWVIFICCNLFTCSHKTSPLIFFLPYY